MLPNFMAEKLIINYEDYKLAVEKLALTIEKSYKPSVLVGIMRGAAPMLKLRHSTIRSTTTPAH